MIIDGHAHSCGEFFDADETVLLLDSFGIDKVVLCPGRINHKKRHGFPRLAGVIKDRDLMFAINPMIRMATHFISPARSLEGKNEYVYAMVQKHPDRIVQFYWADPNRKGIMEELESQHASRGFKGVKLHQCSEEFQCCSDTVYEISEFAGTKGMPVFIHLYSPKDVLSFAELAGRYPATTYIVAHLIGLELLEDRSKELQNVYMEISPFEFISDRRIYKAIKAFGAHRVIFGSDTPYGKENLKRGLERLTRLQLPPEEKELIWGLNMQRLLRL